MLDGPLAFDNAISMRSVATKGITSTVAGQADILGPRTLSRQYDRETADVSGGG